MKFLLAHGSSDSIHGEQVRALAENVSSLLNEEVGTAFLSDKKLPQDAQILPLFLGAGKHMSEDIPKLAAVSKCSLLAPLAEQSESIAALAYRSEEHTSELQSLRHLVCRLLLEKKKMRRTTKLGGDLSFNLG